MTSWIYGVYRLRAEGEGLKGDCPPPVEFDFTSTYIHIHSPQHRLSASSIQHPLLQALSTPLCTNWPFASRLLSFYFASVLFTSATLHHVVESRRLHLCYLPIRLPYHTIPNTSTKSAMQSQTTKQQTLSPVNRSDCLLLSLH